ncbi:MAG: type II toxin-antitoxin system Phd/YefM family antitoxin [Chromatiaceae bacterium]|jgi:prevent-host-death family protein|nr:type II toxin-antitoxin system Phd/YefM family antitoxin [Chromatiaceae bacterium]MBP8282870.1 type II toxin-antitoxin system Phd/YefM family antitoxin [Chromatiaceae bacterium]
MTLTVNVHKAKTHLSKLPEQAHAGEEIILAKAGKPYARLMPLASKPSRRQPGGLAGYVTDAFFESLPSEEPDAWEGR